LIVDIHIVDVTGMSFTEEENEVLKPYTTGIGLKDTQ